VSAYDVLQGFDGAVVSGHEGAMKPSPVVFGLLVERYGIEPAETLFIDDSLGNVEGAQAVGFHAHHFRDAPTLRVALREHGLLP